MSAIKRFAGQTAIYGLSTVISRLLNFILTPIYTTIYPPKVFGTFTFMYSWASMLNALLAFGMETTFFRYLNKYEGDKQKVYNNTFLSICLIAGIFLLSTAFFVTNISMWMQKGEVYDPDYARYIRYFIYILVADALAVIPFARLRAEGRALRYSLLKLTNILTFIGLNLFFIFLVPYIIRQNLPGEAFLASWYREGWVGYVFISNLIASALTLVLLLPELLQLRLKFDVRLQKDMLLYSAPILIANISFIINEHIDKIFLRQLLPADISEQELGIYGACCKLAIFLSIFIQAFRLGAEPFFFSHSKSKNSGETYAQVMDYFVITVCLIFVLLSANIEIIKYFLPAGSPEQQVLYWSGLKIVPILLFGYVNLGIYINLSIWYKLSDQTRYGLYISGIGAILTVVLNLIFIPKYSYVASAWISFAAYSVMMAASYLMGQRNYPIPYHLKKNLAYLIVSVCLVFVSFVLFNRSLIAGNTLFLIFALVTIYLERNGLRRIWKSNLA